MYVCTRCVYSGGETIFPCEQADGSSHNGESLSKLCQALVADARNGSSMHAGVGKRGDLWNRDIFEGACAATGAVGGSSSDRMLRVAPVAGRALLFRSAGPDGLVDPTTWHAGCATLDGGEKHILTFFRSVTNEPPTPTTTTTMTTVAVDDVSEVRQPAEMGQQQDVSGESSAGDEGECDEGWSGHDCRECAPGYSGDFCTRDVKTDTPDSAQKCDDKPVPSRVVARVRDPNDAAGNAAEGDDAEGSETKLPRPSEASQLEELHVFDGFLSASEVAHLSALGRRLVQTKYGTVKGYMSRAELSKIKAAKADEVYMDVRCIALRCIALHFATHPSLITYR